MCIFNKNLKIEKLKKKKARKGERPVVTRKGKGMWGAFYLQPLGAGLEGRQEASEKILEKGGI